MSSTPASRSQNPAIHRNSHQSMRARISKSEHTHHKSPSSKATNLPSPNLSKSSPSASRPKDYTKFRPTGVMVAAYAKWQPADHMLPEKCEFYSRVEKKMCLQISRRLAFLASHMKEKVCVGGGCVAFSRGKMTSLATRVILQ